MIIGVDAGSLGIKDDRLKVGVYQMAVNVFREVGKLDTANTYLLYSFYPIDKTLLKSFGKNFKNIVVTPAKGWTKIWLPLQLLKDKPDIFVGLNQSLPLKLPLQTYKSIIIIHDTLFEKFPKMYPDSFRKLHKETKSAAQTANKIIVPSLATKKDIEKYYKIDNKKIKVIFEGVRQFDLVKQPHPDPLLLGEGRNSERYFLFVGALKPLKNVPRLLEAFENLVQKSVRQPHPSLFESEPEGSPQSRRPLLKGEGKQAVKLYIVGGDKWKDREIDKTFKFLPKEVQKEIKFLGIVDDSKLAVLYKNAIAFVSPSLSEGFGLTFLEAMSFGTPVIGPNAGSVPEVVGSAGILVEPTNVKEIVNAMEKMLDSKTRSEFSKRAKIQSQKFSWKTFAKGFLETVQMV